MINMTIDIEVLRQFQDMEVCPVEYMCAHHKCSTYVYQNYEDCPRYRKIHDAMRRDHHGQYYRRSHRKEAR